MRKTLYIIIVIIFAIIFSSCATKRKANDFNEKRGLMLLENTELKRNNYFNSREYHRKLKRVEKKFMKDFKNN